MMRFGREGAPAHRDRCRSGVLVDAIVDIGAPRCPGSSARNDRARRRGRPARPIEVPVGGSRCCGSETRGRWRAEPAPTSPPQWCGGAHEERGRLFIHSSTSERGYRRPRGPTLIPAGKPSSSMRRRTVEGLIPTSSQTSLSRSSRSGMMMLLCLSGRRTRRQAAPSGRTTHSISSIRVAGIPVVVSIPGGWRVLGVGAPSGFAATALWRGGPARWSPGVVDGTRRWDLSGPPAGTARCRRRRCPDGRWWSAEPRRTVARTTP